MKKLRLLFMAISLIVVYSLNAQVGISINDDGSAADGSAMLDVKSNDKGFLTPHMSSNEIWAINNPAEGLIAYNTETKRPVFYNGTSWLYYDGTFMLEVGMFARGGVIFYLDGNGGGLVCAVSDQSSGTQWGCYGTGINGADGTAIGTGAQNTIEILAGCQQSGIAAELCDNLEENGKKDWFLPSKDELNEMYQNKSAIDATAIANGGAPFVSDVYWSSSEASDHNAWYQDFSDGYQNPSPKEIPVWKVRAVRAF